MIVSVRRESATKHIDENDSKYTYKVCAPMQLHAKETRNTERLFSKQTCEQRSQGMRGLLVISS